jgi:DNA-binding NarL/FixJ family response regulator
LSEESDLRILIADSYELFCEGLISLISNEKDIYVVGQATSGIELIEKYHDLRPDFIITNFHLNDLSGIKVIQRIRRSHIYRTGEKYFISYSRSASKHANCRKVKSKQTYYRYPQGKPYAKIKFQILA